MVSVSSYPHRRGKIKGIYVCNDCNASFLFLTTLQRHLSYKNGYKSFSEVIKSNRILVLA